MVLFQDVIFPNKNTGTPRDSQANIKVIELVLLAIAFASQKAPASHRVHRGREMMVIGESMIQPSNLRPSHPHTDLRGYHSALNALFSPTSGGEWARPELQLGSCRKQ